LRTYSERLESGDINAHDGDLSFRPTRVTVAVLDAHQGEGGRSFHNRHGLFIIHIIDMTDVMIGWSFYKSWRGEGSNNTLKNSYYLSRWYKDIK